MKWKYLLYAPFYRFHWYRLQRRGLNPACVFFCTEPLDYIAFAPVQRFLKPIPVVSDNPAVFQMLHDRSVPVFYPRVYPRAVIMCRHQCERFPVNEIIKIGMRHGPYHFKKPTNAFNYNLFNLYLTTSEADSRAVEEIGALHVKAVGYPKLDPIFNGEFDTSEIVRTRARYGLRPHRPTLFFSATYRESGMSAFTLWADRLSELAEHYNILVSLHPWFSATDVQKIAETPGVSLIHEVDPLPAIMVADVCIGDTSSILAECCALDKPIISFRVNHAARSLSEIEMLLERIGLRINTFDEMVGAVKEALAQPKQFHAERLEASRLMFDTLDGHAGERAAAEIVKLLPFLRLDYLPTLSSNEE
jgi:hypothetical protein